MNNSQRQPAQDIRDLSAKLTAEGWDRLRGLRLAHTAARVINQCKALEWLEACGRAEELAGLFAEFAQEAPTEARLQAVLKTAIALADLLDAGQDAGRIERDFLPAQPQQWLFALTDALFDSSAELPKKLAALGFSVLRVQSIEEAVAVCQSAQVIFIAPASWLTEHEEHLADLSAKVSDHFLTSPLLVAIADTSDFRTQVKARQLGAKLLLDLPLDATRLVTELAGLAWMPRNAYRVMLVDDDSAVLALHANQLKTAGFEVLTIDDPVAARDLIADFAPEACVLDVEMPACRGTDLTALLRRDKRFTRLPVIYLSAFGDIEHQLDARHAGGEDYLVKPVDTRLLVAAVMARTQQFRLLENAYYQRHNAWFQLDNLRTALDAHAIVSVTTTDGTIIDANHKFCELSGYSREELVGHNHRIVKSGHHPAAFFDGMWRTLSAGRSWRGEVKNRSKDGSSYWVKSTIIPILDDLGAPKQYLSIRTDITAQKRIQAKRQHQSRLLDLLRQILQQYLASPDIEATSSALLEGVLRLTDSAFGFLAEVLYDSNNAPHIKPHALSHITWDNETRQLWVSKKTAAAKPYNLDKLMAAVLRSGEMATANILIDADDTESDQPAYVDDFIGLPIYHGNVLVGIVGLSSRLDGYDVSSIADFLQPLTDTYANIIEAARQRHFQQQAIMDLQRTKKTAQHSPGLSEDSTMKLQTPLSVIIAHSEMLQIDGTLDAETRQHLIAIVKSCQQLAQLNTTASADNIAQPSANAKTNGSKSAEPLRILIAEDNPANQAVLRMQLSVLGYSADIAADGVAAMLKWQAGGHALLLTDRNMPGMDGLELTRAIRASEKETGTYIPIIAITAAQEPEENARCRRAGMDDILFKPIELDALRNMLERWLPLTLPLTSSDNKSATQTKGSIAILDTDYLTRIIGYADHKQKRELVDLFTSTARADLLVCRQHLRDRNHQALAQVMHKLKSSARMVGALGFANLADSLEGAAKTNQLTALTHLLAELNYALGDVKTAASQLMTSSAALNPIHTVIDLLPDSVLIVDDDPVARRQITLLLSSLGIVNVLAMDTSEAALIELDRADGNIDLLISDLKMPGMDGIEFMRHVAVNNYQGPIIIVSGVEEQLLQTAADMVRAKGMNLLGTLKKPMTRDALLQLLARPRTKIKTITSKLQRENPIITPDDIREGIRCNAFEVHFQPKVDAMTLSVVGLEALARWQHNGNWISPDVFITIAEQHQLIAPLSEVLITKALVGGARLAAAGYSLSIAVNVSATWLSDLRLPEFILASVNATGFSAEKLILEITETGVMADMNTALDVMTRLRLKGFKLSIDDFGTGYSSIEQLQRIPFGELKLDRSFVQGAVEKSAARSILASTVEMAKKMGLSTVAEGIEIQAELDLVCGLGCDLVQGWFIAKAMPLEPLLAWLHERGT